MPDDDIEIKIKMSSKSIIKIIAIVILSVGIMIGLLANNKTITQLVNKFMKNGISLIPK
jgi:hypothetical protein